MHVKPIYSKLNNLHFVFDFTAGKWQNIYSICIPNYPRQYNVHAGISFDIEDQISLNITYWISLEYFLIGCRFGKMTTGDLVVGGGMHSNSVMMSDDMGRGGKICSANSHSSN